MKDAVYVPNRVMITVPENDSSRVRISEGWISLGRGLIWPLFLIAVYVKFHGPINEIAQLAPRLLAQSSKLSVGNITIEINRTAQATGNQQLIKAVGGLSAEAIRTLLETRRSQVTTQTSIADWQRDKSVFEELQRRGLLTLKTQTNKDGGTVDVEYGLTSLGISAYDIVINAIMAELRQ